MKKRMKELQACQMASPKHDGYERKIGQTRQNLIERMQGERYNPSLKPFCIQHNKGKVMPDAVVVRRNKENSREGKESVDAVEA
jgi:hypothetical protein